MQLIEGVFSILAYDFSNTRYLILFASSFILFIIRHHYFRKFCTSNSRNHLKTREQSGLLTVNVFCLTMLRRFNQVVVSYDASKEERVDALERRHKEVEERLKEKTKALTLDD